MKRRWKWLIIIAISFGGVVAAAIMLFVPRQPTHQGRPLDAWLADLASPNYRTQQLARAAIREMGPAAVPFLTNSLAQRESIAVRAKREGLIPRRVVNWARKIVPWQSPVIESRNAAIALQDLGQHAVAAIPPLIAALSDPSPVVAHAAATALGAIGSAAVPALRERLKKAGPEELPYVLQAVQALGTNAAPLAPEVGMTLENAPNPAMAGWAQMTLAGIGPAAVPVIMRALVKTNRDVRLRGLTTLVNLGPAASPATNILFELTRSEDPDIRLAARKAFGGTLPPREAGLPIWLEGLRDPDARNVETSLRFLIIFPASVRQHSNEIAGLTLHPTNSIRQSASNALTLFRAWPK